MNLNDVLQAYESLSGLLTWMKTLHSDDPWHAHLPEIKLLASDFLLDGDMFEMFGFENLYEMGLLNPRHWQDMQRSATLRQLDDIERAVGFDDDLGDPHLVQVRKDLLSKEVLAELQLAMTEGNLITVRRLLAGNEGRVDDHTLDLSLQLDQLDIFWSLLKHGAHIVNQSIYPRSRPLYTAAKRGHMQAVHALLERGAPINNVRGSTPLTGAAAGGHLHIVQSLHQLGAKVNGNKYKRPIVAAAARGHLDVVQYLIEAGANVDATCLNGSALSVATREGHDQIVTYLLDRKASRNPPKRRYSFPDVPLYLESFELPEPSFTFHPAPVSKEDSKEAFELSEVFRLPEVFLLPEPFFIDSLPFHPAPVSKEDSKEAFELPEVFRLPEPSFTFHPAPVSKEDSKLDQQILAYQLRRAFKKLCRRIFDTGRRKRSSQDFAIFASNYGNPGSKFRKGMRAIRQLIEKRIPENLDQIICCLMLADAMRMAKLRDDVLTQQVSLDEYVSHQCSRKGPV